MNAVCWIKLLPPDDEARTVVALVEQADLSQQYDSGQRGPGRSPIDPQILLSLWLSATIKRVGSAGFGATGLLDLLPLFVPALR